MVPALVEVQYVQCERDINVDFAAIIAQRCHNKKHDCNYLGDGYLQDHVQMRVAVWLHKPRIGI